MRRACVPLMSIVPEGWAVLLGVAALAAFASRLGCAVLALLLVLALAPLAAFFSESRRKVPGKPLAILAPIDGTVVRRRECHDDVLQREAVRILIRVDPWGGYCFRSPMEGEVYLVSGWPNRRVSAIRADEDDRVILRVTRGTLLGARPVWLPFGERVGQGRRCGVRRLARELEMLLPPNVRVEVELGAQVRAGETVLATILRKTS